jgi:hypothetical protein
MPRFNYENPSQTAKAKVEVLRDVVHHYKGVIELPWKYKIDDASQTDRAEVEALKAVIGLFTGEGLPEYLDPKPVEATEEIDVGEDLGGGKESEPPPELTKTEGEPDANPDDIAEMKEKIEALSSEAPELAENLENLGKNLNAAAEELKNQDGETVSGDEEVPSETPEPKDENPG